MIDGNEKRYEKWIKVRCYEECLRKFLKISLIRLEFGLCIVFGKIGRRRIVEDFDSWLLNL